MCFFFTIKVVKICKECVEKTEPVLADTHIYLLRMWSTLSEVQAYLQYFNDAADYARKMVDGYLWVQRHWAVWFPVHDQISRPSVQQIK